MAMATGEPMDAIAARYDGQGYGKFKDAVADSVIDLLTPIQARYEDLRADQAELDRILAHGAERARAASAPTLSAMYERMGFVAPPRQ
jgi:tryptophanyl-tRNA synthetase